MGDTQYSIQYYAQNGALSYMLVWANSESQAVVDFTNRIREQKRCCGSGSPRWGEIYRIGTL